MVAHLLRCRLLLLPMLGLVISAMREGTSMDVDHRRRSEAVKADVAFGACPLIRWRWRHMIGVQQGRWGGAPSPGCSPFGDTMKQRFTESVSQLPSREAWKNREGWRWTWWRAVLLLVVVWAWSAIDRSGRILLGNGSGSGMLVRSFNDGRRRRRGPSTVLEIREEERRDLRSPFPLLPFRDGCRRRRRRRRPLVGDECRQLSWQRR